MFQNKGFKRLAAVLVAVFMLVLMAGCGQVKQKLSETTVNPRVASAISTYYQMTPEQLAKTRYFYNYVDLDGDGHNEILALAVGPATSGTGGSSMLWLDPENNMKVLQAFTLVHAPILIEDSMTNGHKNLVLRRYGGGAKDEIVRLEYIGGRYQTVNEGQPVATAASLKDLKGVAILCDDMSFDKGNGISMRLR